MRGAGVGHVEFSISQAPVVDAGLARDCQSRQEGSEVNCRWSEKYCSCRKRCKVVTDELIELKSVTRTGRTFRSCGGKTTLEGSQGT